MGIPPSSSAVVQSRGRDRALGAENVFVARTTSAALAAPYRELIVVVTASMIAVTLAVHPRCSHRIVRWARLRDDGEADREHRRAEITTGEPARNVLPTLAGEVDREIADELRYAFNRA
jgi:hypothetical protein